MRYEELTDRMKAYICNGCGGKGGIVIPPKAIFFNASCNHHDYGFWKGGSFRDMMNCNATFFSEMIKDCNRLPFWKRPYYYGWCATYYWGVFLAGSMFFNFTERPRNITNYAWSYIFENFEPDDIIPWEECRNGIED